MFMFGLISIFIMIPLGIVIFAIGAALSVLIIGIPILMLALPTYMIWLMQSLYVYIEEDTPYFKALNKGWKITFEKYWHVVGSSIIISLIVMIAGSIFSIIPAIAMMSSIITTGGHPEALVMTPTMIALNIVGLVFSYIAYNVLYVQQGLVYYSSQENSVNYQSFSEIESIGKDEE